jgi:hypothetical protein
MKRMFFFAIVVLCVLLLNSCIVLAKYVGGIDDLIHSKTETRPVGAFTAIEILGGNGQIEGQLDLFKGAHELVVTADRDDIANIRTTVMGTRLVIDASQLAGQGIFPRFKITMPTIEELVVTSCNCTFYCAFSGTLFSCTANSGDVYATLAPLTYDTVAFNASGNSFDDLRIDASILSCTLSGNVGANLSGSADSSIFVVSDHAWVNIASVDYVPTGSSFTTANATVHSSGAGSVLLRATSTLDATITGSGSIYYWGNPTITQNITGIGLLIKKD